MATFPTFKPSSRTFTSGRHSHSEIPTYKGTQTRVRTSNVLLDQRLRLTFTGLTESQMLAIKTHYLAQQGSFIPFDISNELLSGLTTPSAFTPSGYSWIYAASPEIEDLGLQRHTVSVELITIPPEGASIAALQFTAITITFAGGPASVNVSTAGATFTVTASFVGGVVADNTSSGLEITVTASLTAGAGTGTTGGDPDFSSVVLLLPLDGTNGSTTMNDSSNNALAATVFGNAQISTTDPKFGTGSLLLDGTGDYIRYPDNVGWDFGTGDFTVETWIYMDTVTATMPVVGRLSPSAGGVAWGLRVLATSTRLSFYSGATSYTYTWSGGTTGTWHHVAATRSGTTLSVYANGTRLGSGTNSANLGTSTAVVYVGTDSLTTLMFDGKIDDVRITKGVARYTGASYTTPTAAHPTS